MDAVNSVTLELSFMFPTPWTSPIVVEWVASGLVNLYVIAVALLIGEPCLMIFCRLDANGYLVLTESIYLFYHGPPGNLDVDVTVQCRGAGE